MRTTMLLLTWLAACSGDGGSASAPTLSQLELEPTSVAVGQNAAIAGTVAFADADGDVAEVGMTVVLPDGRAQDVARTAVTGTDGLEAGTLQLSLQLTPPAAGIYTLEVFVIDEAGHESNRVSQEVTAE
jgi:hypothetical protein